jgi:AcrR family transcriptional regulator
MSTASSPAPVKKPKNRERILEAGIDLFNQSGVVAVTTNHIASHLGISPGNLYFHFRNKEEIVAELFDRMCVEVYDVWAPQEKVDSYDSPLQLIERSYEVFWKYRFFHREMYHLRRKDPTLARKWKTHISKCIKLFHATYRHWIETGVMKDITDPREMEMISDVVLITSITFLQFFESPERPATRRTIRQGVDHILRFLLPYHMPERQPEVRASLEA